MNYSPVQKVTRAALTALFALSLGSLSAQVAAPAPAGAPAEPAKPAPVAANAAGAADEMVVTLSPFSVDATRDQGFVAVSALAGGRLATDLKDTPAAYSVLTREFIDALGLTDIAKASVWVVNSTNATDDGRSTQFGNAGFATLGNFRGVRADTTQINFFPAYFDYDSYNLERFDFARGPNSILFGSGSNGGTANALYKVARPDKAFQELQVRYGSWDYYRASLDINQPITKELAVRANLLWQDNNTWRTREFEKRKAGSFHLAYTPFEKTKIIGVADKGKVQNNFGLTTLGDRLSGWDGITTFAGKGQVLASPANSTGTIRNGSTAAQYYVFSPGLLNNAVVNWANTGATQSGGQNAGTPIGGRPIVGAGINQDQNPILDAQGLPTDFLNKATAGSKFLRPGRDFSPTYDGVGYTNDYTNYIAQVDQQIGRHVYLTAAANHSTGYRVTNYIIVRGLNNVWIDVNQSLPTGDPNPNFLQPYLESTRDLDNVYSTSNGLRASAAFIFDNTRWGNFRLNTEVGRNHVVVGREKYRYGVRDPLIDSRTLGNNLVRWRYYFNVPDRPLAPLGTVSVVDPVTGSTRNLASDYLLDINRPTENVITNNKFDYAQAALNANLFKGKLNLLGAFRRDDWSSLSLFTDFRGDLPNGYDGTSLFFKPAGPANYFTLMYTPKLANGTPTGPAQQAITRPRDGNSVPSTQYANDVFQDDFSPPEISGVTNTHSFGAVYHILPWVSAFGNMAQTWSPPGSNQRIDGSIFVPVTSEGWDAGLRFNLLDGRLQTSVTRYGSSQENLALSTGTGSAGLAISLPNAINAILQANVVNDLTPTGVNNRGLQLVPSSYSDTAKRKTKGWEFEAVANLAAGWRLMFNYAIADATQGDGFADTRAYLAANDSTLKLILADAGISVGSTGLATINPGITTSNSPDSTAAFTAWNQLQGAAANLTPASQKVARLAERTGNLFTDYTIQSGTLKDFRFGGGINYRGNEIIGFRGADTIVNPASPTTAIDDPNVDALTPVYRPDYYTAIATLGYTTKIFNRPVRFDLVVDNLFDRDTVLFYNTAQRPPVGDVSSPARVATPNQYYYIKPRSFTFSATVAF